MAEPGLQMPPRPTGLTRALLRAPRWIYRLGLGRLLGRRFLLLRHRGRTTGAERSTVLEVILRRDDEVYAVSGFGRQSDWLRNIHASPPLLVETGGRRFVPEARFLDEEEATSVLADYARRYPRAAATLAKRLYGGSFEPGSLARSTEVVAFRPRADRAVST